MKMHIKKIMLVGLLVNCFPALAYESYFNYEHKYGTASRYHGDNFGISVDFDKQAYVGLNIDLFNKKKNQYSLNNIVSNYYEFYMGYNFKLAEQLTLTPNLELRFYSGGGYKAKSINMPTHEVGDVSDSLRSGARYTPGLKLTWDALENFNIYTQYRYEYRKVSRKKREDSVQGYINNRSRNRFDVGLNYQINNDWSADYNFRYFKANYILQNDKKNDYQHGMTINWQATEEWLFKVGAEDVAKNIHTDTREAKLKFGINYHF